MSTKFPKTNLFWLKEYAEEGFIIKYKGQEVLLCDGKLFLSDNNFIEFEIDEINWKYMKVYKEVENPFVLD